MDLKSWKWLYCTQLCSLLHFAWMQNNNTNNTIPELWRKKKEMKTFVIYFSFFFPCLESALFQFKQLSRHWIIWSAPVVNTLTIQWWHFFQTQKNGRNLPSTTVMVICYANSSKNKEDLILVVIIFHMKKRTRSRKNSNNKKMWHSYHIYLSKQQGFFPFPSHFSIQLVMKFFCVLIF